MPYYHGSSIPHKIGTILTAKRKEISHKFDSSRIDEELNELYRPSNKISRLECIFMSKNLNIIDTLGGAMNYLYLVKPIGKVEKSNLVWQSIATQIEDEDMKIAAIEEYWKGTDPAKVLGEEAYDSLNRWEYRARQIIILQQIDIT
jgi:hypothetical protein